MRMKSLSVRRLVSLISASALVAAFAVGGLAVSPVSATTPLTTGQVIFDNAPAATPPNLPSVGYEATSTSEWGTKVTFAGTQRTLAKVNRAAIRAA